MQSQYPLQAPPNGDDYGLQSATVPNLLSSGMSPIAAVVATESAGTQDESSRSSNAATVPIYAVDSNMVGFDISDPVQRRRFARKVFTVLLLQNLLAILFSELTIWWCGDAFIAPTFNYIVATIGVCVLILMYVFRDARRSPPVNLLAFAVITALVVLYHCSNAAAYSIFGQLNLLSPLAVVVQLLAIILYTYQSRFKFSNINAMLLLAAVTLVELKVYMLVEPIAFHFVNLYAAIGVSYMVYDMQLMLSGYHGYNLMPHEYIYAVVNIYADVPHLYWRLLRFFVLDFFIRVYEFLKSCCFAEVC